MSSTEHLLIQIGKLYAGSKLRLCKTKAMDKPIAFFKSLQHLPDIFKFLVMDKMEFKLLVLVQKNHLYQHNHIFS